MTTALLRYHLHLMKHLAGLLRITEVLVLAVTTKIGVTNSRKADIYSRMDLEFEDLFSGDCSVIILLTYSHIKTDQQLLYLITFFTISEEGIIVLILALNTRPIISTRNLRINCRWRVRIPRAVSKQAKFIITEHHHICSTLYALGNKGSTYIRVTLYSFWTPSVIQYLKDKNN
jgi:hypothetical protein